eukprot:132592_1
MEIRKQKRRIMTEKVVSHPFNYGRNASFLDEAFSLLYNEFVVDESDCSSFEESESEHNDTMAWNIGEGVENDDSIIFEPVALARGRDDPTPASCSSPTFSGRVLKPHDSSLLTSFTAPEDHIDRMVLEKQRERVEETCVLSNMNVFSENAVVGNRPIVPTMLNKVKTSGANLTLRNRPVVPMMSKCSHANNSLRFPTCHTSNGTWKEMHHYNANQAMTTATVFENELSLSSKKLPMMEMNSSQAKFPSSFTSANALAACNGRRPNFFTGDSADPNHKKRNNRQIDQVGSQKNDSPNKARIVMKMRLIERHGLKTRIVMEPCLVHD